jgi:uncharacterized protein
LSLPVFNETFAVGGLDTGSWLPEIPPSEFFCLVRTREEVSLICPERLAPTSVQADGGWTGFRVEGTLEFSGVGILGSLTFPLANAGIPVFAISMYSPDYLFVGRGTSESAIRALASAGHTIRRQTVWTSSSAARGSVHHMFSKHLHGFPSKETA